MKDEAHKKQTWFQDQDSLLKELKNTPQHWGEVPKISGYDRLVEIRRGGQGVVYQARQQSTNRMVAVKVLLEGALASEANRLRFQREIEMTARLRHPHIVPIYDSGLTQGGNNYYAMEYVEGAPLDDPTLLADKDLNWTLKLFIKICDAIRHAHQHGIIHRDIKPNNILVDQKGDPHVLDFGLAKVVETPDSMSVSGQFLGSLAWASPEQFDQSPDSVDLRTDVYSLGVILYQFLTGRLPHPISESLRHTINAIVSKEPKPPREIRPNIPDDVETVALRSLAKAPDRRYQSVGELMGDVEHFLNGEPIDAKRDRFLYVLRKTMGRHKTVTSLGTLVLLLVLGFAITMAVLYPRTLRAEREAKKNLTKAQAQALRAEAVRNFLTRMLASSDPLVSQGRQITLREKLDTAARWIGGSFEEHPLVEAEIRSVIGKAYYGLGQLDQAEEHDQAALILLENSPDATPLMIIRPLINLGIIDLDRQRFKAAQIKLDRALELCAEHLGKDHITYGDCLQTLAQLKQAEFKFREADALYAAALAVYHKVKEPVIQRQVACLVQWSGLLISIRRLDQAIEKLNQAMEIINKDPQKHSPLLGSILFYQGLARFNMNDMEAAETALTQAMESHLKAYGENHQRYAEILTQLGHVRRELRRHDEAEALYRKALAVFINVTGQESAGAASSLWNIAQSLWFQNKFDGAEENFKRALTIRRALYGPEHHYLSASLSRLGMIYTEAGQWEKALPYLKEAASIQMKNLGKSHHLSARASALYGACLVRLERFQESEPILLQAFEVFQKGPNTNQAYRDHLIQALIDLYTEWNKPEKALVYKAMRKH